MAGPGAPPSLFRIISTLCGVTVRAKPNMPLPTFKRGVSLYSYQDLFYREALDLEGCIAAAADTGATGLEMLVDQMVPGYPSATYNLSDQFIAEWSGLTHKYGVEPIAFDIYGESKLYKGRICSDEELADQLIILFRTGKALGFKIMRINFLVPVRVIERLIPAAEDLEVTMAIEVHAPHSLRGPWVQDTVSLIQRSGTSNLGIMPDFGTFCREIPRLVLEESRRKGVSDTIISYLSDLYHEPNKPSDMVGRVLAMGGNEAAEWLARRVELGVWINDDPRFMADLAPHIVHAHAKFYEMTEDLIEPSVRYDEIIPVLAGAGYQGYIMSEYEGQRLTQDIDPGYDEVEQVRRHQAMLARYLGETAPAANAQGDAHGTR